MDARFRIRTQGGEEILSRTVEVFSELVRSGAVHPEDMVFDALTGEWAPATAHPMVQLFRDPLVEDPAGDALERLLVKERMKPKSSAQPPAPPDEAGSPEPPESDDAGEELALDLVEPEAISPEEEARAFIAKMDEERRSDPDLPALFQEAPLVDEGVGAVVELVPEPAAAKPMPDERPQEIHVSGAGARSEASTSVVQPTVPAPRESRPSPPRYRSRAWVNATILGGAVVALALSVLWPPAGRDHTAPDGLAQAEERPAPVRAVPVTEEQTRALAYASFLEGVEGLRQELAVADVPRMWLEGRYLADAGAYPDVRGYWERYLAFVAAARAAEVSLYRGAYLGAASEAGLSGPVRSLRLASAQEAFAASRERRTRVYDRVEGLARAALALDDLLLGMKGRVTYEPIAGPRVSADPVIEAAGTDDDAQLRLEAALDRVLEALQGPGGVSTRDRAGVPGWLTAELRALEGTGYSKT